MTYSRPPFPERSRRWLVLALCGLAQLMVVLDLTIVNIALPSAQRALHFSNGDRQWIVTAYALAFGALLPLGGRIGDLLGGVLTEYLSWRWCLYVNLFLAVPAVLGASALLAHQPVQAGLRLDLPGALTASVGLFCLVYGFSHAESAGWTAATTLACLGASVALLALFVVIQRRSTHPLLPLRVLADRNRAGSYSAVLIAGIGMFGVFFVLTYYLQQTLGYSPVRNGLAFLPMVGAIMLSSITANTVLLRRTGPRPLIAVGMELAAGGMVLLTRLGLHASYTADILPALLVVGAGLGLVLSPAMNTATAGVDPADSGIASALVTTGQQIGGSIGIALLNTLAASATATYLSTHHTGPALAAHATLHGYTVAFWTSAGVFATGAVLCGLLLKRGALQRAPSTQPALTT